ncbi:bifunctional protein GlmU-like [Saccoglossus kowalevskii]
MSERTHDGESHTKCANLVAEPLNTPPAIASPMVCYALRLGPGEEIFSTLMKFVDENQLDSAFIVTCVGSVTRAKIRLAHATAEETNKILELDDKFEIVSLVGTLSAGGHLHISLSDRKGAVIGGHVLGDLKVFTTAEIVIGQLSSTVFTREMDTRTGFGELVIKQRKREK